MRRENLSAARSSVGFSFGEASFLALDWTHGPHAPEANQIVPFRVGPAPSDSVDGVLGLAHQAAVLVDLRSAPAQRKDVVDTWLRSPQKMHTVRGFYDGERAFETVAASKAFDALLYVNRISPIHRLKATP